MILYHETYCHKTYNELKKNHSDCYVPISGISDAPTKQVCVSKVPHWITSSTTKRLKMYINRRKKISEHAGPGSLWAMLQSELLPVNGLPMKNSRKQILDQILKASRSHQRHSQIHIAEPSNHLCEKSWKWNLVCTPFAKTASFINFGENTKAGQVCVEQSPPFVTSIHQSLVRSAFPPFPFFWCVPIQPSHFSQILSSVSDGSGHLGQDMP